MKRFVLAVIAAQILSLTPIHAADYQEDIDVFDRDFVNEVNSRSNSSENSSDDRSIAKRLIDFIYGNPVRDGILVLPFGVHTRSDNHAISMNNLIGLFQNSVGFGTFVNSFDNRIWYLVNARNLVSYHDFGLDYYVGVIYGYEGFLSTLETIPFHNSFLFKGNLNPVVSVSAYYTISDQFQLQVMYTPGIALAGVKYNF